MSRLLVVTVGYQSFIAPAEVLKYLEYLQPVSRNYSADGDKFYRNTDSVSIQFVDSQNVLLAKPENDK